MIDELLGFALPPEVRANSSRVSGEGHEARHLDLVVRNSNLEPLPYQRLKSLRHSLTGSSLPILVDIHG